VESYPTPDRSGSNRSRMGSSSTESTSGAANRGPLRGGSREAALSSTTIAQAGVAGGATSRKRGCRWARNGCSKACVHPTAPASPADVVTSSRQEVFERIGSGRSFCREQSRRRAPGERKLVRSLALETSAGLAPQGASPPGKRVRRRWSRRRFGNCFGRARVVSGRPTFNELARAVTAPQAGTQSARSGLRGTGFRRSSGRARGLY